jgi:aminodeoxyfutalosine synthase
MSIKFLMIFNMICPITDLAGIPKPKTQGRSMEKWQKRLLEDIEEGREISKEDMLGLFYSKDVLAIGQLAHKVRLQKNGEFVYYARNRHINYTNICENHCKYCALSKKKGEVGAYFLSPNEIVDSIRSEHPNEIDEIHLVGGCHPDLNLDYFL